MTPFYLTIDDGPSEDTETKLKLFEANDILAVWFCLGKNIKQYPEEAVQIIQNGHILANHSYCHPFFTKISFSECKEQIQETEMLIEETYKRAGLKRPTKLFRYPYGERGHLTQTHEWLKELGFQSGSFAQIEYKSPYENKPGDLDWLWSYDIQEWAIENENGYCLDFEQVKSNFIKYLASYDKNKIQMILTHDHPRTDKYFPALIDLLLNANIFIVLPEFVDDHVGIKF